MRSHPAHCAPTIASWISVLVVAIATSIDFHTDGRPHVTTSPMYETRPLAMIHRPMSRKGHAARQHACRPWREMISGLKTTGLPATQYVSDDTRYHHVPCTAFLQ